MAGVIRAVEWKESEWELYERYRSEGDVERRKRLHALWLVRSGMGKAEAARQSGTGERTLGRWLGWYRLGGLDPVLARVPGCGGKGRACWLSVEQREELLARCGRGEFASTPRVRSFVEREWGVRYTGHGMYQVLARLGIGPKVPRPRAEKADPAAQEAYKRGGLVPS
jgi:transposase